MSLIDFYKEYPDEISCKLKFKEIRDKVASVAKDAGAVLIIGRKTNDSMNVKNANTEQRFNPEQ